MRNLYKFFVLLGFFLAIPSFYLIAQVGINTNNDPPNSAAMLDVQSTDKGFLPPRMTTEQMNSIVTPPAGLLVYNTAVNALFWFNGSSWKRFIDTFTETDPVFTVHPASGITAGNITNWTTAYINRITAANGTAPLALSISGNALFGSIAAANATTNGYITSTDWNSFNNKVSSQWVANGQDISFNTGKVGIGTTSPASSAAMEVSSANSGFLLPRMAFDQRNAIASPAEGLMVFCTNCTPNGALSIYSNGAWRSFTPCNTPTSSASANVVSPNQIIWNWTAVPGATGYKWNTTENYGTAIDMGVATTKTETGILCGTDYTRYVWANNECGISIPAVLSHSVPALVPVSPTAGTHTAALWSIVWNWNTVPDATGYKWNTEDNFATATEMMTATTKSETGLLCNTPYTRYVWAYNGCGESVPVALVQSTLVCTACGASITINHLASGGVAPVDKTVTYGTVNNIPGELTKCWITRNLGAAQQATVVSDATEASAGWYFQFNRKQGYQYTTSRTPSTAWNATNDNLSATWEAAKDPCAIELGTGWRIPTNTEWTNVDAGGSWTNWTGPYGSALKLHAAGGLGSTDGSLFSRGSNGYYWSRTQYDAANGWNLNVNSSYSAMNPNLKAFGFSIRCLRDF